jgi:hypothetical protein
MCKATVMNGQTHICGGSSPWLGVPGPDALTRIANALDRIAAALEKSR